MRQLHPTVAIFSLLLVTAYLGSADAARADLRNANTTADDGDVMQCVYPISGAYGILPRFLYYATLVLAIFGRNQEWLVIGALASALTYAGTAAIHATTLCTSRRKVFDLDILGVWAILSTGALAYITLINWSKTMRNSRARFVMICWGVLVGMGLIFGRVEQYDTQLTPGEKPCHSSNGVLLSQPFQLADPSFNCTYECFSVRKPMRDLLESVAIARSDLTGKFSNYQLILLGPVMFAAYAATSFDSREHSPSQLLTRLVVSYLSPNHREEILKSIYKASNDSWYGGYFAMYHYVRRAPWSLRKILLIYLVCPWYALGLLLDILCIPLLIANVVLNELNLIGAGLPTNESPYSVGQWGPVVSSLLVVVAAVMNKGLEVRERRKNAPDIPREEKDVPLPLKDDDSELEGQTSGVVKRSLVHQETLKDISQMPAVYKK